MKKKQSKDDIGRSFNFWYKQYVEELDRRVKHFKILATDYYTIENKVFKVGEDGIFYIGTLDELLKNLDRTIELFKPKKKKR